MTKHIKTGTKARPRVRLALAIGSVGLSATGIGVGLAVSQAASASPTAHHIAQAVDKLDSVELPAAVDGPGGPNDQLGATAVGSDSPTSDVSAPEGDASGGVAPANDGPGGPQVHVGPQDQTGVDAAGSVEGA